VQRGVKNHGAAWINQGAAWCQSWCGVDQSGCGVDQLGCYVAQLGARQLAVGQPRVRIPTRHPRDVSATELFSEDGMERSLGKCLWM
jgi:hypothetical protein